jgi:hypothetical protein
MKCGKFVFEPFADKDFGVTELRAIHFFPKVLKALFKDNPPKFLFEDPKDTSVDMTIMDGSAVIDHYM